jgi:hypothetical protein
LQAVREAIEVHERRSGDIEDSFIRVGELADLGLAVVNGGFITSAPTGAKVIGASWTTDASHAALNAAQLDDRFILVPYNAEIVAAFLLTSHDAGSCEVDVWRASFDNYPPTAANSIAASSPLVVSSGIKYYDETLTDWIKNIVKNDVIGFSVVSTSTFHSIQVGLIIRETP